MGDKIEAGHFLVGRRLRTEEDALVVILDAAGVFHATELITRQHDKAIVLKGVGDSCVFLHPAQRQCYLVEHDGQLSHLGGIGFAVECRQQAAVTVVFLDLELARREREQIGGDGLTSLVGDALPSIRDVQFQAENGFQVRLVKTREHAPGMIWDKQRVEVVFTAVQCLVATIATKCYRILSLQEVLSRDDDMLILQDGLYNLVIDKYFTGQLVGIALEVNLQVFITRPVEQ